MVKLVGWIRSRLAAFRTDGRGRPEAAPIEAEAVSFAGFLRQQARWIAEHAAYEKDMAHSLSSASEVLVRFDIGSYAANIDRYFAQRGLYARKVEDLFRIAFTILAPPSDIAQLLSREHRKQLFAATLVGISLNTSVSLPQLVKTWYSLATGLSAPFNGCPREDLLELYKQAVEIADRSERTRVERRSAAELLDNRALLTDILGGLGVRQRRDLARLFEANSPVALAGSLSLQTAVAAGLVYLFWGTRFLTLALPQTQAGPQAQAGLKLALTICCGAGLLVSFVTASVRYAQDRLRRSHAVRTLRTLARYLGLEHNALEAYLKERFDFPLNRLR
jgi:hypothetical protein